MRIPRRSSRHGSRHDAADGQRAGNITTPATGSSGAVVTFSASASDIVDGSITPSCLPPSGSTLPVGTTTVTCTATDVHGNTGSGSFSVTVQDTTPPVLTVPANMNVAATGAGGAVVTYTASAVDAIDPTPTLVVRAAFGQHVPARHDDGYLHCHGRLR